jgi:hypothetical protein
VGALESRVTVAGKRVGRRARPAFRVWLAVVWLACLAAPLAAQVRPDTIPRDTIRRDTIPADPVPGDPLLVPIPPEQMVRDTLPTEAFRETEDPDPVLAPIPVYFRPLPVGWASARWEWSRDELLRFHGFSLLELVERVPGLTVVRAGAPGRPAGITALGMGGGAVRVFRDGFEVDPLTGATLDLQQIGLADLESVRVRRTAAGVRIDLTSFQLREPRAYSLVEFATGNYRSRLLRALFARPFGGRSVATASFDVLGVSGFRVAEPGRISNVNARWQYSLSPRAALQAEYRLAAWDRQGQLFPERTDRRELLLRGRVQPFDRLTFDAMVGRVTRSAAEPAPFQVDLASVQGAARASLELGLGWVEAVARARDAGAEGPAAPRTDLSARAALNPLPLLALEGEVRSAGADGGVSASQASGTVRLGPLFGLSAFYARSTGERLAWTVGTQDPPDPLPDPDPALRPLFAPLAVPATGDRAGVEWMARGASAGVALVSGPGGLAVPLGLAPDRTFLPVMEEAARGVEAFASVPLPLPRRSLRLEGWLTAWDEANDRLYLPTEQARLSLVYHDLFFVGQLEPTLRFDLVHRGRTLVPVPGSPNALVRLDPYQVGNLQLQIRILDVRAFFVLDNAFNFPAADLPAQLQPGSRMLYGVRWEFRN